MMPRKEKINRDRVNAALNTSCPSADIQFRLLGLPALILSVSSVPNAANGSCQVRPSYAKILGRWAIRCDNASMHKRSIALWISGVDASCVD
jgi:hypothetical protein